MLPIGYTIAFDIPLAIFLALSILLFICAQSFPESWLDFFTLKWIDLSKLDTTKDRIQAAQAVATATGGLAVIFNLYYGAKRSEAFMKNAEATTRNAKVAEDGQITERFSRAIEQLSNENVETRIGGIYTLERIAWDSERDHWTVMETLSAFIRENAPYKKRDDKLSLTEFIKHQNNENQCSTPNTDIQAAFTVIGRRNHKQDPPSKCINLSYSNLQGSDCSNSYLNNVNFSGSNLEQTNFENAKLKRANFGLACLNKAKFGNTELQKGTFCICRTAHGKLCK